jgi:hypothetical protein
MGSQPDTSLAARLRGSGGPLPPFCHGLEPQKNVKILSVTPMGVFFLAANLADFSNPGTLSTAPN